MNRGWIVVALLLSLGVNVGLVAVGLSRRAAVHRALDAEPAGPPPVERFGRRLADRLDLDADRRERFVEVQRRLVERTAEERQAVQQVRLELRRELLSPEPDRERLEELLGRLSGREAALNRAFVENVLETRELLAGPELEAYLRFLERFAPGRGDRMEHRPRGRMEHRPGAGMDRREGPPRRGLPGDRAPEERAPAW